RRSDVIGIVMTAVEARLERWAASSGFDIVTEAREMGLEIIFRMIGVPVAGVPEWGRQYSRFLLAGLPSKGNIRGPLHWVAMRARRWIDDRLGRMVDELRASQQTSTLVGAIANGRGEDGKLLERDLVVANLRLL